MSIKRQGGFLLIAAIVLVVVLGFFASVITFLYTGNITSGVNQLASAQALFVAEGGLERGTRALLSPTLDPAGVNADRRLTCATITGGPNLTNTALGDGEFTVTGGASIYPTTAATLNGAITAAATTITVNVGGAVPYVQRGRIMIDRELINYSAIVGNTFQGAVRGVDGTTATSHVTGTRVGQYQCDLTSTGGVPIITNPNGLRQLNQGVQLQEAWAVGDNGVILRWRDTTWSSFVITGVPLRGVSMDSYANGWAVGAVTGGRSQIRRWNLDGTPAWDAIPVASIPAQASVQLNAVHSLSHNEAWAVGNDQVGGPNALILRFTAAGWGYSDPGNDRRLNGVFMLDTNNDGVADDGWAVGERQGGSFALMRWNIPTANTWNQNLVASGAREDLNGVYMISNLDGWAVGQARSGMFTIVRWNNPTANVWNVWSFASANNRNLNGIFMLDSTDGWAVGDNGVILRWNSPTANAWNIVVNPNALTANDLRAVSCANRNDCWAVGNAGTILHWDGNNWAVHPQSGVVTAQNIRSIHIVGPRQWPRSFWREIFP